MTIRTVDLSGNYEISFSGSFAPGTGYIGLGVANEINPNWLHGDLMNQSMYAYSMNLTLLKTQFGGGLDLTGQYEVVAVDAGSVTLDSPEAVNADWTLLADLTGGVTGPTSATLSVAGEDNWIGPYVVEDPLTEFLVVNVLALQGVYTTNKDGQQARTVSFEIEATPVNDADDPIGAPQTFASTVEGSDKTKELRARTLVCPLATPGRHSVRARRVTDNDYDFEGTVVDEIKWQDLFGMGPVDQPDFGNVTTVRTRTFATQGALAVKERKLNLLVQRKVPHWTGAETFSAPAGSDLAADIFVEICRDPVLGNRQLAELDLASIYGAVTATQGYFGWTLAGQFGYTFDNDNTSFEEMASVVANAVFCTAYRQGSVIRLFAEQPADDSTLLFNHRNKIPGSETRTIRFGPADDNDGIELEYTNPDDESPATIYLPADKSARKPRKINALGVRHPWPAYWLAWRAFNKLMHQNVALEFTALPEAALSIRNERLLVTDNTRPDTQDGEVEAQAGLQLTLSQNADLSDPAGHTIFLQLIDATIEAIPITPGTESNQVVLAHAPRIALSLDETYYTKAQYTIVPNRGGRSSAFLLTEKSAQDNGNYQIGAINYSGLYYLNDTLQLWLPFPEGTYLDGSPFGADGIAAGGAVTVFDDDRGKYVHLGIAGASVGFDALLPEGLFTKAAWVKRSSFHAGEILSSATESFGFAGPNLSAGHGGAVVSAAWPGDLQWHHAAAVYSGPTAATLDLYIDGEPVGHAAAVPTRVITALTAFGDLEGRADDLRLWRDALSPETIRDLYRTTRVLP